jgi:hypothetical protein
MATQPTIIVISSLDQLPSDLQARLRLNGVNIPPTKNASIIPSPTKSNCNCPPNINPTRPITIQTGSPALRMVVSNKPYNYQVGPLEYLAGRLSQLW